MAIIKEKDVRMGAVRVVGNQADYRPVTPRVISSAIPRQELRYCSSRSAIIKAGTFRMENHPRVIKADIRPVVKPVININPKDNLKGPALAVGSRVAPEVVIPRFKRAELVALGEKPDPIKQEPVRVEPVVIKVEPVKVEPIQAEQASAVTDAVFVPQLAVPESEAYRAEMSYVGDIDAEYRTTAIESLSVRKYSPEPTGFGVKVRGFFRNLGVDRAIEQVVNTVYPRITFVAEYVRISLA